MRRQIAIFTDVHGLLEPIEAILDDIHRRGIQEIYSLGDNIGGGPNPKEVMELLKKNKVVSLAGNAEDYISLGMDAFRYVVGNKKRSCQWTENQLENEDILEIKSYPHSLFFILGGKRVALCHFANDVRIDYRKYSTWDYQSRVKSGKKGYTQFYYTNSFLQKLRIRRMIRKIGICNPRVYGYLSADKEPLFKGKKVSDFDLILQGHVHFKYFEKSSKTLFYTVRAAGMAYENKAKDLAFYIILEETVDGFSIEEVYVKYNRDKMLEKVKKHEDKDRRIAKYVELEEKDIKIE